MYFFVVDCCEEVSVWLLDVFEAVANEGATDEVTMACAGPLIFLMFAPLIVLACLLFPNGMRK